MGLTQLESSREYTGDIGAVHCPIACSPSLLLVDCWFNMAGIGFGLSMSVISVLSILKQPTSSTYPQ